MTFTPRRITACRIIVPKTGCCSVTFEPMMKIAAAFPTMSSIELLIAPEPNAMARPATVEE